MDKINKKKLEKTFTSTDGLVYNSETEAQMAAEVEAQLKSDRYLPTNNIPFKKDASIN